LGTKKTLAEESASIEETRHAAVFRTKKEGRGWKLSWKICHIEKKGPAPFG
jgi:hypothetical protein